MKVEVEILLIEDNAYDAELAIRALKKVNLANHLVHLQDGEEALRFLFGNDDNDVNKTVSKPKLILLDIKMPKVDGLEVLKQLKSDARTKNIPVVIMTSSQEGEDVVKCYQYGVNSYVVKPLNFDNFSKAVSDLGLYWVLMNHTSY